MLLFVVGQQMAVERESYRVSGPAETE